jgi:hypothetical protein
MRGDLVVVAILTIGLLGLFIGIWWAISRFRSKRGYRTFWTVAVVLLTLCWGSALINALIVGRGLPGNGWDGFGAAVIFFFSLPALVLDIIFVFNWPKNTHTRNDSA